MRRQLASGTWLRPRPRQWRRTKATAVSEEVFEDDVYSVEIWRELIERANWAAGRHVTSTARGGSVAHRQKVQNLQRQKKISWSKVDRSRRASAAQ